jgi:hypothetical protein
MTKRDVVLILVAISIPLLLIINNWIIYTAFDHPETVNYWVLFAASWLDSLLIVLLCVVMPLLPIFALFYAASTQDTHVRQALWLAVVMTLISVMSCGGIAYSFLGSMFDYYYADQVNALNTGDYDYRLTYVAEFDIEYSMGPVLLYRCDSNSLHCVFEAVSDQYHIDSAEDFWKTEFTLTLYEDQNGEYVLVTTGGGRVEMSVRVPQTDTSVP